MTGIEVGTVCVKTAGRKTGEKVIVLDLDKEKSFATVIGEKVKKKQCSFRHLIPLNKVVKVNKSISQKDIAGLLKE
ncbi:MAG: 50S ribosomal protein L14e [Candidatus Diapherotrites archaeon]|uniref:50S ribosomal protein L14e n=1 Tax=Candidatus Iainarchaeum sp. TaxID=3101447 RepID=A0A2D6M0R6_9ARCH|nr:50S ribosomal protein L14e [Candidatus Diapherotrites archaeon]|tara:strand:+ start:10396 stop:10623 length:228 start_codon:yes stop_codon:yes gene_type:complete